jgi:hypothetical protein
VCATFSSKSAPLSIWRRSREMPRETAVLSKTGPLSQHGVQSAVLLNKCPLGAADAPKKFGRRRQAA